MSEKILIAIDAPDPDNLVLLRMAQNMFGEENVIGALMTGRPIKRNSIKGDNIRDWSYPHSRKALDASADRLKNFSQGYDSNIDVYDGGIATNTLVPHYIHFADYYKFWDSDPLDWAVVSPLNGIENLANKIGDDEFTVLVGGPMTGLSLLLQRFPKIASQISSVHAMYASLGNVKLMSLGDENRGNKQFNVYCDPVAGKYVTDALDCPIYFVTSECTRDDRIGFETPTLLKNHLQNTKGNDHLMRLYTIWFANAVQPRKEQIYIHDACAAVSTSEFGKDVYDFSPMSIKSFPSLPNELNSWGTIDFEKDPNSNIFLATELKNPEKYLELIKTYVR